MDSNHFDTLAESSLDNETESSVSFFIKDSLQDNLDSIPCWDLKSGLPALNELQLDDVEASRFVIGSEAKSNMADCPGKQRLHLLASTSDSDEHKAPLVFDTVSDASPVTSSTESEKNVTVVERKPKSKAEDTPKNDPENVKSFSPMVIPDSPTFEETEKSQECIVGSYNLKETAENPILQSEMYTSSYTNSSLRESQNLHLKFTQSEADETEHPDPDTNYDEVVTKSNTTLVKTVTSPLKLGAYSVLPATVTSSQKPSFQLQKPQFPLDDFEMIEESEGSPSVFKRVQSGHTTPQKSWKIRDDSDEFMPLTSVKRKIASGGSSKKSTKEVKQSPFSDDFDFNNPTTSKKSPGRKACLLFEKVSTPAKSKECRIERTEAKLQLPSKNVTFVDSRVKHHHSKTGISKKANPALLDSTTDVIVVEDLESSLSSVESTQSYDFLGQTTKSDLLCKVADDVSSTEINVEKQGVSSSDDFINPSQKRMTTHVMSNLEEDFFPIELSSSLEGEKNQKKPQSTEKSFFAKRLRNYQTNKEKSDSQHESLAITNTAFSEQANTSKKCLPDCEEGNDAHDKSISPVHNNESLITKELLPQPNQNSNVTSSTKKSVADPYAFENTPSLNNEGAVLRSSVGKSISSKSPKRRSIKLVRRVFKKRIPLKKQESKSSSTDDSAVIGRKTRQKLHHQAPEKSNKRVKKQTSQCTKEKKQSTEIAEPLLVASSEAGPSGYTLLHNKSEFNIPSNPPQLKTGASSSKDLNDQQTETQHLRQAATEDLVNKQAVLNKETSESNFYEIVTVKKTVCLKAIYKEKTIVEVFTPDGKLHSRLEKPEIITREKDLEPLDQEEISSKHIIPCPMSPSRSTSTVTTGDLADVSSSSLGRTSSTGSKISNPSLDIIPCGQSLLSVSHLQNSLEVPDHNKMVVDQAMRELPLIQNASKDQQKRHSAGSSSGQDLFSTPNQSIIDRADSQLGKIVSSSHSTPCSHLLESPNIEGHCVSKDIIKPPVTTTSQLQKDKSLNDFHKTPPPQSSSGISKPVESVKQTNNENPLCTTPPIQSSRHFLARKKDSSKKIPEKNSAVIDKPQGAENSAKTLEERLESADTQSTGFSVHCMPASAASGDSNKGATAVDTSLKSSNGVSPEISLQGAKIVESQRLDLTEYKSKVEIGAKVMGKWKDGFYYPGILHKVDRCKQKFVVKFDDGSQSVAKPQDIILASDLPVGQSVMVMTDEGFYEPGMVMGHSEAEAPQTLFYHVARDDGVTQKCSRAKLILSEDQAACLLSDDELRVSLDTVIPFTSKPGEVSLDNLVEGKRQHRSTRMTPAKEASTSGLQPSAEKPSAVVTPNVEMTRSGRKRKMGPQATSTPACKKNCTTVKKSNKSLNKSLPEKPKTPRKTQTDLFGKSNPTQSKLFSGMSFVLTHKEKSAQHKEEEKRLLNDSSLEISAEESTDIETQIPEFEKENIKAIIEKGGGTVLETFDENTPKENLYLVAAEHQRTVKYLKALAAGITVVSHQWVLFSFDQSRLQALKAYILPAGISLEKKKLMERHKGCCPLENLTVMVVSENQDFTEAWSSILTMAKSKLVTKFPSDVKYNSSIDVVVSDATCPTNVVKKCQNLNVPLVSSEWVAQSIINGHLVDYLGHEKYKYNLI
ncbi:uncharacterized protein LOC131937745 isoform X2 [Physella acuta]|uniref:uncharacterized protein LOC131937745 isoform X2 n=1 Tax=Physella acuta TaxID=109671 RepID=UPI0027DE7954|nr:uncharacterized protein LOC131937745 isoform X2 [Physella acuta]